MLTEAKRDLILFCSLPLGLVHNLKRYDLRQAHKSRDKLTIRDSDRVINKITVKCQ